MSTIQLWPEHKVWPAKGTIAHVLEVGTIESAALPGGFFVRCLGAMNLTSGHYRVLTLPESTMRMIALGPASWHWNETFHGYLRGAKGLTESLRIEQVPLDIADAVEAMLKLDGFNEDTDEPMIVDDGWVL